MYTLLVIAGTAVVTLGLAYLYLMYLVGTMFRL